AASILSFDPEVDGAEQIGHRRLGETLHEGMFLIVPLLDEVGLGVVRARHGDFSQIWKGRLRERWQTNPNELVADLLFAGLRLVRLEAAVRHWLNPPTTVIHAPQQKVHFEILLRVLNLVDSNGTSADGMRTPLLKLAWNEIRRSRGEAIKAGVLENDIVDEQLHVLLGKHLTELRAGTMTQRGFCFTLPAGEDLAGQCLFHLVCGVEADFRAPETEFRVVRELGELDRWRD
ncbi:MAG: hypothetical protein ABIU54_00410, partial [Candidatus Eisenbacteria bacterium]